MKYLDLEGLEQVWAKVKEVAAGSGSSSSAVVFAKPTTTTEGAAVYTQVSAAITAHSPMFMYTVNGTVYNLFVVLGAHKDNTSTIYFSYVAANGVRYMITITSAGAVTEKQVKDASSSNVCISWPIDQEDCSSDWDTLVNACTNSLPVFINNGDGNTNADTVMLPVSICGDSSSLTLEWLYDCTVYYASADSSTKQWSISGLNLSGIGSTVQDIVKNMITKNDMWTPTTASVTLPASATVFKHVYNLSKTTTIVLTNLVKTYCEHNYIFKNTTSSAITLSCAYADADGNKSWSIPANGYKEMNILVLATAVSNGKTTYTPYIRVL